MPPPMWHVRPSAHSSGPLPQVGPHPEHSVPFHTHQNHWVPGAVQSSAVAPVLPAPAPGSVSTPWGSRGG